MAVVEGDGEAVLGRSTVDLALDREQRKPDPKRFRFPRFQIDANGEGRQLGPRTL